MKQKVGTIYGIFPVVFINGEPHMKSCFLNNYCYWLFDILNNIEGMVWSMMGVKHMFVIKIKEIEVKDNDMAK